jgi:hypothetical protein
LGFIFRHGGCIGIDFAMREFSTLELSVERALKDKWPNEDLKPKFNI